MAEWNKDALILMQGDLKLNVILRLGLSFSLHKETGGFMNRAEVRAVEGKPSNAEQMGELIRILLGKRNRDFYTFCTLLRSANYSIWADILERKAREFKEESGTHVHN